MKTLIITEKSSQAKDLRAALGDRFGQILPAEGHLLRLAEPEEVNAEWTRWSCTLLKPDGLYPTRPAADGNKPSKLKAIAAALKTCDQVIPGDRLRPRRAAHRPGDPRPSRLSRPRAARPVYRSGPKNLAASLRTAQAER